MYRIKSGDYVIYTGTEGMKVIQEAFDKAANEFLIQNIPFNLLSSLKFECMNEAQKAANNIFHYKLF